MWNGMVKNLYKESADAEIKVTAMLTDFKRAMNLPARIKEQT